MRSAGVVVGGAPGLGDVAARVAVQRFRGDGYTRNVTTGRRDTNGFDELTARARLRWHVTPQLTARLSLLHSELDNGYDAFAIDNSRVSLADDPGRDAQRSTGSALRIDYDGARPFKLQSISTAADSAIFYSFDGDWGADPTYDFTSRFVRSHRTLSQDLRVLSRDDAAAAGAWLAGIYLLRVREDSDQLDLYNGDVFRALDSRYAARNLAAYGEYIGRLRPRWSARLGLRSERRSAEYSDSDGTRFSPAQSMWGGHAVLDLRWAPGRMAYLSVSRGYKAGGVNIGAVVPQSRRGFGAELLMSIESGVKLRSADQRTELNVALFRMHRADQQVSTSFQLDAGDPLSFIYLTDNAARGVSYGLEASGGWAATPALRLEGSLGLLGTRLRGYEIAGRRLDGRDAAHAPRYQYRLSGEYRSPRGWFARADLQGVDAFYFSDSHDQKSRPYTLLNLRAGFAVARWQVSGWVRNAGNARYSQRGFFFGNEPPDFPDRLYVQPGEPRVCGVSVDFSAR
jgi:outer membrane cobalamin receptor